LKFREPPEFVLKTVSISIAGFILKLLLLVEAFQELIKQNINNELTIP